MWIEVHQGLLRHRKTIALAQVLGITRAAAVGHIVGLWLWALDNAAEGDLHTLTTHTIATGAEWEGDADQFLEALVKSGFVDDPPLRIHDWYDYAGRIIERRRMNAEYQRQHRQRLADVTTMSALRKTSVRSMSGATVPNLTLPNHIPPIIPLKGDTARFKNTSGKRDPDSAITEEFVLSMVAKYAATWPETEVRSRIEEALNHKAVDKAKSKQVYVKGWLRRDAAKQQQQEGIDVRRNGDREKPHKPSWVDANRERYLRQSLTDTP